ncbi:MAG: hypothetical protein M1282_06010 [Chloroflexi bacterium]|nr:hypothetical protein [Chloroflexota bacterium]
MKQYSVSEDKWKDANTMDTYHTVCFSALLLSRRGGALQSKAYYVGILSGLSAFSSTMAGFNMGMAESSYVESENVIYIYSGLAANVAAHNPILQGPKMQKVALVIAIRMASAVQAKKDLEEAGFSAAFGPAPDPVGVGVVTDPLKKVANTLSIGLEVREASTTEKNPTDVIF